MVKVLFVCLGNICRSPVAEAIFNALVGRKGLEDRFLADSAGTAGYHIGESPDSRSVANARENGISIDHRARQFTEKDFEDYDYIVAMDQHNLQHILNMTTSHSSNHESVFLMRSFQDNPESLDVPDPYYGGINGFQKVFDILHDANHQFLEYLTNAHGN